MSRLCRLKTKSHGEDGIWAYNEIVRLRAEVEQLRKGLMEAEKKQGFCFACGKELRSAPPLTSM